MSKKTKYYEIKPNDEESTIYGSFHKSDIKRMANALTSDLEDEKKSPEKKAKQSLLKRLKKLIED
ncbi:MAG: hypothetical protein AAFZ15_01050 [Bacteroidota bacterium]